MAEVADTAYDVLEDLDGSEDLDVINFALIDFASREIGVATALNFDGVQYRLA